MNFDEIIQIVKDRNCKKISFSGTHGTGKSTSCYELAGEMKKKISNKKIKVLSEVTYNSPFPINRGTTMESQLWIATNQIQQELNSKDKYDILICDRTVIDCAAYTFWKSCGDHASKEIEDDWKKVYNSIIQLYNAYDSVYKHDLIIFKTMKNNPYNLSDGKRDTDETFRNDIEEIMEAIYKSVYLIDMSNIIYH